MSDNRLHNARMAIRNAVVALADATAQTTQRMPEDEFLMVAVASAIQHLEEARNHLRPPPPKCRHERVVKDVSFDTFQMKMRCLDCGAEAEMPFAPP